MASQPTKISTATDPRGQAFTGPLAPEKKEEPKSAHFTAYCGRYPQYSFAVPAVRKLRAKEKGIPERETGCTFAFSHGIFDSRTAELTEEEAVIVRKFLETRESPPIWGVHILDRSMETLGSDPAGAYECPLCSLRFTSKAGFVQHVANSCEQSAASTPLALRPPPPKERDPEVVRVGESQ